MWETLSIWLQQGGVYLAWAAVWLLCLAGILLSCISISGTWLVSLAAILAMLLTPDAFPGWLCVLVFLLLSGVVEGVEWFAGTWGVKRRGGSGWAGAAALLGGLIGMVLGTGIPIPIVGSLVGMMLGGFALTFAVEYWRLSHTGQAATIAWGAVVGRAAVIVAKVVCTLLMIAVLIIGMLGD